MKKISAIVQDFLHGHVRIRNGVRWVRWQAKKIPVVNRVSIAVDAAYFRNTGAERPHNEQYAEGDAYSALYAGFILPKVHGRVLDVGCGHGYLTQKIAGSDRVKSVVGVDKIADFRAHNPKITYHTNDLANPEDFPGTFDVITSCEFIEHITEDEYRTLLQKIIAALGKGGTYIGSTPRNPTNFKTFSGSRFHLREYNQKDLTALLEEYFSDVAVVPLSEYCLAWEAREPHDQRNQHKPLRLHLGCGEKYLEGYVNIDFPDTEQNIIKTKADVFSDMHSLSYPAGTVDEIRSHHMFEHFTRAEALKLLMRWRTWLKPGGLLVIETPDFSTSASFFLASHSRKRRYQLSRHMLGSEEAGWALHKDFWDKEKFEYVLEKLGYENIKINRFWNGLAKHAEKIPKFGKFFAAMPNWFSVPVLNILGNLLPESFYQKYGSNKMPNILVHAQKDASANFDEMEAVKEILSLYLAGKEGERMLSVWLKDYKNF